MFYVIVPVSIFVFSIYGWAIVNAVWELFRKRDKGGLNWFEPDKQFDMASWFEPMSGTKFYRTDDTLYIERDPKHLRY